MWKLSNSMEARTHRMESYTCERWFKSTFLAMSKENKIKNNGRLSRLVRVNEQRICTANKWLKYGLHMAHQIAYTDGLCCRRNFRFEPCPETIGRISTPRIAS